MSGTPQRLCPQCGRIISKVRNGLYACDMPCCHWEGTQTPIYYIEFPDTSSGENREPIYQGMRQ